MRIADLQESGALHGDVIATSIDGLCVRNMTLDELQALQDRVRVEEGEDALGPVADAIVDIARDPQGGKFEDLASREQALALGFATIRQIFDACIEALTGGNG